MLLWQLLVMSGRVKPYLLPAPRLVLDRWLALARSGVLWHHTAATLQEALAGFLVAAAIAIALGYVLARSEALMSVLAPYIALTQAVPILAFAPLLVVWFGLGLLPKVIICVLIVFFPMLINTIVGLRSIDQAMLLAARGLGASRWRVLWRIEVPLALRTLLGGVKMGITLSMAGAVVGEFVAATKGLGYLLSFAQSTYNAALMLALVFLIMLFVLLIFALSERLEKRLTRWRG